MKRLFLALSIPEAMSKSFEDYLHIYRNDQHFQDAKWTGPENLHITVFFLGEVTESHLLEMRSILRGVAGRMTPFTLHFERVEFFAHKMPKMIWGRFQRNLGFLELNQECKKFMKPYLDMTKEEEMKEPIPHVTLARLRKPVDPKHFSFQPLNLPSVEATELHLYESVLTPQGPSYTLIESYRLGVQ